MNAFKLVFSAKACFKVVVRSMKIGEAIVFCRSLLLSTTVLNDTMISKESHVDTDSSLGKAWQCIQIILKFKLAFTLVSYVVLTVI